MQTVAYQTKRFQILSNYKIKCAWFAVYCTSGIMEFNNFFFFKLLWAFGRYSYLSVAIFPQKILIEMNYQRTIRSSFDVLCLVFTQMLLINWTKQKPDEMSHIRGGLLSGLFRTVLSLSHTCPANSFTQIGTRNGST